MICSKCDTSYEFYGQRHKVCRECKRAYDKEWRQKQSKKSAEQNESEIKAKRISLWVEFCFGIKSCNGN